MRSTILTALMPLLLVTGGLFSSLQAQQMPESVVGETPREYWQFLFLYESTTAPGQKDFIFRPVIPVYGKYENRERAYTFRHWFYPMYARRGTNYWSSWTILELFYGDSVYHKKTGADDDLSLSPLFFWGKGESDDEKYKGFFPFYGSIRNKLTWDSIRFFLFPLYANWEMDQYKAHAILWPLITWGKGPVRSQFRFLPFYSRKVRRGSFRRTTVLWPFFQWGSVDLDKRDPRSYFFFFPFYGTKQSQSGSMKATTILWPLFSWGHDEKTGSFDMTLFFLYKYGYGRDPQYNKHMIFPFWGKYRYGSEDRFKEFRFVTPLYMSLDTNSSVLSSDFDYFVPIYQKQKRYLKQEREMETYYKVWPLFKYKKDSYGNLDFATLALWPLRSDSMERIWSPLLAGSLVEYRRYENGDRFFSSLFRLFARYWNKEKKEQHLFVLGMEYHKKPRSWSFQILGGFLGYGREKPPEGEEERGVKNNFRLLWFHL